MAAPVSGSDAPTVRHLVEASGLGLLLPAGKVADLDRTISWAHSTELRDPTRYLRGEELVCTVGISLQTAADCVAFADALAGAGAAGVCFGIGDGHDEVPEALLTRCREHGLPVLIAPPEVPFSEVSRFVAEFGRDAELAVARATTALVPELLSALRRHESIRGLLDTAGRLLDCYFLFVPQGTPDAVDGEPPMVSVELPGLGTLGWIGRGDHPEPALLDLIARFVRAARG